MGLLPSRPHLNESTAAASSSAVYKYPPKTGSFFGDYFIMGVDRFEMSQPEAFLFGENTDLNFLGGKAVQFPYPTPTSGAVETTKCLQALIHIRRDSVKLVRHNTTAQNAPKSATGGGGGDIDRIPVPGCSSPSQDDLTKIVTSTTSPIEMKTFNTAFNVGYNIEFTFDCDCPVSITIYFFATEEVTPQGMQYSSKRPETCSKTYRYDLGANQTFSQPAHKFYPSTFKSSELGYSCDVDMFPVVIHCVADRDDSMPTQSQSLLAIVEKSADGHGFSLKPLKQKLFLDGVAFVLQEVYGIENKQAQDLNGPVDDYDDVNLDCVICMSDLRDTLILPCRHLCLCFTCAGTLRYKANNCPICRAPFRALLQIRTFKAKRSNNQFVNHYANTTMSSNNAAKRYNNNNNNGMPSLPTHNSQPDVRVEDPSRGHHRLRPILTLNDFLKEKFDEIPLVEIMNGPIELQRVGSLPRACSAPQNLGKVGSKEETENVTNTPQAPPRNQKKKKSGRAVSPIQELPANEIVQMSNDDVITDVDECLDVEALRTVTKGVMVATIPSVAENDNRLPGETSFSEENEEKMDDIPTSATSVKCQVSRSSSNCSSIRRHSVSDNEETMERSSKSISKDDRCASADDIVHNGSNNDVQQGNGIGISTTMSSCSEALPANTSMSSVSSTKPLLTDLSEGENC